MRFALKRYEYRYHPWVVCVEAFKLIQRYLFGLVWHARRARSRMNAETSTTRPFLDSDDFWKIPEKID